MSRRSPPRLPVHRGRSLPPGVRHSTSERGGGLRGGGRSQRCPRCRRSSASRGGGAASARRRGGDGPRSDRWEPLERSRRGCGARGGRSAGGARESGPLSPRRTGRGWGSGPATPPRELHAGTAGFRLTPRCPRRAPARRQCPATRGGTQRGRGRRWPRTPRPLEAAAHGAPGDVGTPRLSGPFSAGWERGPLGQRESLCGTAPRPPPGPAPRALGGR